MRKILLPAANVCRVLVGALFVVSGLIKINDALGFRATSGRHTLLLDGSPDDQGFRPMHLMLVALAVGLVLAATRSELVRFPEGVLQGQTADVLSDLVTRVFMLIFIGAALFLTVHFVKRLLRLRQLMA